MLAGARTPPRFSLGPTSRRTPTARRWGGSLWGKPLRGGVSSSPPAPLTDRECTSLPSASSVDLPSFPSEREGGGGAIHFRAPVLPIPMLPELLPDLGTLDRISVITNGMGVMGGRGIDAAFRHPATNPATNPATDSATGSAANPLVTPSVAERSVLAFGIGGCAGVLLGAAAYTLVRRGRSRIAVQGGGRGIAGTR
jgi:hypothetical protein